MVVDILKKLIEFRTESLKHKENEQAFKWIKEQLKAVNLDIKKFKFNDYPSIVLTTNKANPKIILAAHMDVVPATDDLFGPKVISDKIIGRGTFDMKFAIACYIQLLIELKDYIADYDFGVMITSDEELGGSNGVGKLVEKYKPKLVMLPDGGGDWEIEESAKGVYQLIIKSYGKSEHGSRTWMGNNAIENLMSFLTTLKDEFPKEPCGDNSHYHDTINIGNISGGKAVNQVPDYAEAKVDIRFTPDSNFIEIERLVNSVKSSFKLIDTEVINKGTSYKIDKENEYLKTYIDLLKSRRINPKFRISHGSSDARFFIEKNIPVILTRPMGGGHHSENEWIDINSLNTFYDVLKEFVLKVSRK